MDLSKYQELTGINVSSARQAYYEAQLRRVRLMMETLLGFSLYPTETTNLYNELGKSQMECACSSVRTQNLDNPDEVVGKYRLFPIHEDDIYFHVDPFTNVHNVKLVRILQGESPRGITVKTFKQDEIRIDVGIGGIKKYLQRCNNCFCYCECVDDCIQLAVDADWAYQSADDLPEELQFLMADMVTFYSNGKRYIKSESITSHSYSLDTQANTAPESMIANVQTLKKYAGPYGSVSRMPL